MAEYTNDALDKNGIVLSRGDFVEKTGGDYTFYGDIKCIFRKRNSEHIRLVVENSDGMLFIFNPKQLEKFK